MMAGVVVLSGYMYLSDGEDLMKCLKRTNPVAIVACHREHCSPLQVLGKHMEYNGDISSAGRFPH
jgi:hypothetical protein